MKKHKLFKINDTYYMSNLEPIYEEDIIKLVEERDKYKKILDKIKEYIKENKYKKMGGYGNNEDEDIEECLFEDDIWEIEKLLEEIE